MKEDRSWDQLARYMAGEAAPDEAAAFERWLSEHPERRAAATSMRRVWETASRRAPEPVDVDAAWARVAARLPEVEPTRVIPFIRRRPWVARTVWARPALRAAAIVVVAIGGVLLWERQSISPPPQTLASGVGERRALTLRDGSRVVLAPDSRIRVPRRYGRRARTVELVGEALFEVVHDARRPFTVVTTGATARDLGTRFTVRSVAGGGGVEVVVAEGAVAFWARGAEPKGGVELGLGDRGWIRPGRAPEVTHGVDVDGELAWTRGRLVFTDTPLGEVIVDLKRWYGFEVRIVEPTLASRRLTASFERESAADVLEVVARSVGASARRDGDIVVLEQIGPQ